MSIPKGLALYGETILLSEKVENRLIYLTAQTGRLCFSGITAPE